MVCVQKGSSLAGGMGHLLPRAPASQQVSLNVMGHFPQGLRRKRSPGSFPRHVQLGPALGSDFPEI